jgi:hypothetical protein
VSRRCIYTMVYVQHREYLYRVGSGSACRRGGSDGAAVNRRMWAQSRRRNRGTRDGRVRGLEAQVVLLVVAVLLAARVGVHHPPVRVLGQRVVAVLVLGAGLGGRLGLLGSDGLVERLGPGVSQWEGRSQNPRSPVRSQLAKVGPWPSASPGAVPPTQQPMPLTIHRPCATP